MFLHSCAHCFRSSDDSLQSFARCNSRDETWISCQTVVMGITKKCARVTVDLPPGEEERQKPDHARGVAAARIGITVCGIEEISRFVNREHRRAKRRQPSVRESTARSGGSGCVKAKGWDMIRMKMAIRSTLLWTTEHVIERSSSSSLSRLSLSCHQALSPSVYSAPVSRRAVLLIRLFCHHLTPHYSHIACPDSFVQYVA